jgi:predicted Ser/Thr protein kinase
MQFRSDQLERGFVLGGYRIDELISRGGMGVVYRATNVALNRIYALKVLAPELTDDDQFQERFKREMRIAASLRHPNVVGIYYAGEQDGLLFLVMDFVHGTDLRQLLRKSGALEPDRAVELLTQLASALDAAHAKGLVHRDVKPANVLLTVSDGEEHAYLTDFGLAKRSDTVGGLTKQGVAVGTVDYMSPEQITGNATDARTDIYALGCVFFQMLTGNVPFERDNSVATLFAHVHEPPPLLEEPLADSSPALGVVVAKAMAKAPDDRYQSAGDFARDAATALQGTPHTEAPTVAPTDVVMPFGGAQAGAPLSVEAETERWRAEPGPMSPEPARDAPRPAVEPVAEAPDRGERAPSAGSPAGIAASEVTDPPEESSASKGARAKPPKRERAVDRYRWPALALLVLIVAGVAVAIALSSGSSPSAAVGQRLAAVAAPVPNNRVTGSGTATVVMHGNIAEVHLTTIGLLNGSPHLIHIHAGGLGLCPPASAARPHNGHLAISTGDGLRFYGPPQVSLTVRGDTSASSNLAFPRFPSVGAIDYTRNVTVTPVIASLIRGGNAVIVVHGIDYDHSGTYDEVLGPSDLASQFTGDSTAPALCGRLATSGSGATAARSGETIYTASLAPYTPPNEQGHLSFYCALLATTVQRATTWLGSSD